MGMYKKGALVGIFFCLFKNAAGAFSGDIEQRNFLRLEQLSTRVHLLEKQVLQEEKERVLLWRKVHDLQGAQRDIRISLGALWFGIAVEDKSIALLEKEVCQLRREITLQRRELALLEQRFFDGDANSQEATSGSRLVSVENTEPEGPTSPLLPPSIGSRVVLHSSEQRGGTA